MGVKGEKLADMHEIKLRKVKLTQGGEVVDVIDHNKFDLFYHISPRNKFACVIFVSFTGNQVESRKGTTHILGPQTFLSSNQCFSSDWYVLWGCFHDVVSSLMPSMMAHQPSHFSGVRWVHFPKSSQTFLWRSRLFAQVSPWVSKRKSHFFRPIFRSFQKLKK